MKCPFCAHLGDKVAFVRFASVYRNFRDLDEFKDELNALLKLRE